MKLEQTLQHVGAPELLLVVNVMKSPSISAVYLCNYGYVMGAS